MADFGEVIKGLKAGRWARHAGWNGKGMHIYLEDAHAYTVRAGIFKGSERKKDAHIVMFTAQQTHQPGWLASQADMLSEDWEVFDPS